MANVVADVFAAHTLAIATERGRRINDCGHVSYPDLTLVPGWEDLADSPGLGAAGAAGYATDPGTGKTMCYPCADRAERERLRRADTFGAYLSSDNRRVITWSGGTLGTVTDHSVSRMARKTYVRVTDVHGVKWYGVGPADSGTYVNMRRCKAAPRR